MLSARENVNYYFRDLENIYSKDTMEYLRCMPLNLRSNLIYIRSNAAAKERSQRADGTRTPATIHA